MHNKFFSALQRYSMLQKGDSVAVGLSGGADSVALLHILHSHANVLGITVFAVHIDHSIRGDEAQRDMLFCIEFCKKLGVELICKKADVPKLASEQGIGLEECGRNCRYQIFDEISSERGAKIATAHTLSDNAETVLFNMARGTSVAGLSGIPAKRDNIIRPLILCTREEIETYCAQNRLQYVTDSTNFDTVYSRNLIRHNIIPQLKKINPVFCEAVGKLSELAAADEAFLQKLASNELQNAETLAGYDVSKLTALDAALLGRAVRTACERHGASPQGVHIGLIEKCMNEGFGCVTLGGKIRAVVKNGILSFDKETEQAPAETELWQVEAQLGENILPNGKKVRLELVPLDEYMQRFDINPTLLSQFVDNIKNIKNYFKNCIDYDILLDKPYLRNRRTGDKFAPLGRGVSKSFKELMRENGIPPEQRSSLSIMESGGKICWLEGFGTACGFGVNSGTKRILIVEVDV